MQKQSDMFKTVGDMANERFQVWYTVAYVARLSQLRAHSTDFLNIFFVTSSFRYSIDWNLLCVKFSQIPVSFSLMFKVSKFPDKLQPSPLPSQLLHLVLSHITGIKTSDDDDKYKLMDIFTHNPIDQNNSLCFFITEIS